MQALSANISNILYQTTKISMDHADQELDLGEYPSPSNSSTQPPLDQLFAEKDSKSATKADLLMMKELIFSDIPCSCVAEDKIPENIYHFLCLENELKRRYGERGKKRKSANLEKLRVIDFSGFKEFCNFYLDSIIDLWGLSTESLQEIYLNDCFDDCRSMSMIFRKMAASCKDIKVLSLGGNDISCPALLDFLTESAQGDRVSLQELMLDNCELKEKSVIPKMLSCLSSNFTNLLHLRLDGCQLRNYSASICSFLSACSSLQVLDLSWNDFGDESSCEIISALYLNKKCQLQKLLFKGNFIGGSENIFDELSHLLLDRPSLRHLDLSCSRFYGAALDAFADSLIDSKTLETLVFSRSVWCQAAISTLLCPVIKRNKSLRTLDISNGGFSIDAIGAISDATRFNTTLVHLLCDFKGLKMRQLFYNALSASKTIEDTGKCLWGVDGEDDQADGDIEDGETDIIDHMELECSLQILYEESRIFNSRRTIIMANTLKVSRLMMLFVPQRLPFEMMEHIFNLMVNDGIPWSSFALSQDLEMFKSTICKRGYSSLGKIHSLTEPFSFRNLNSFCFYFQRGI